MNVFKMVTWRGLRSLGWLGLVVGLAGTGGVFDGVGPRAALAQGELFVTNSSGRGAGSPREFSITVYSLPASGNVAPHRTIQGDATGLEFPRGIAVDAANSELLVANLNAIRIYSRTADGNVPPLRTIQGAAAAAMV